MGHSKSNSERKVYSNTVLPQETNNNKKCKQPNLHLEQLEKEKTKLKLVERKKS